MKATKTMSEAVVKIDTANLAVDSIIRACIDCDVEVSVDTLKALCRAKTALVRAAMRLDQEQQEPGHRIRTPK